MVRLYLTQAHENFSFGYAIWAQMEAFLQAQYALISQHNVGGIGS
jgi:hypothetical protein